MANKISGGPAYSLGPCWVINFHIYNKTLKRLDQKKKPYICINKTQKNGKPPKGEMRKMQK